MNRFSKDSNEILALLEEGRWDELIGPVEDSCFDAKGDPYQFASGDSAKHELAKDVSSFANSSGGVIAIGLRTAIDPMFSGEHVEECRPVQQSLVNIDQYRKLLQEWITPAIPGLRVQ